MKCDCNNTYSMKQAVKGNQRINTYSIVLCALFAGLIALGAFIRIPSYSVPATLQMSFVLLAGMMLGSKRGAISAFVYMVVGLMGIPVFALGGGLGYFLKPTFGYIIGFIPGAYITGRIVERSKQITYRGYFAASLAGLLVVYFIGVVYFYVISRFYLSREIGIWYLFFNCFLITLPGDVVVCSAGALLAKRIKPVTAVYFNSEFKRAINKDSTV